MRLPLVFEEPATKSIAAKSLALAECPKCGRERALTQEYWLTVSATKETLIARIRRSGLGRTA